MPTYERTLRFLNDLKHLTSAERVLFAAAVKQMVEDLNAGGIFRPSLRIKGVQGHPGVFEMTWQMGNGRATFSYGISPRPGEAHIIWRRVGNHSIFKDP